MRLGQEFRVRKSCFFVPTANHVSTYVYYICVYVCVYQPHSSFCRKILCARCWTDLSISFKILSDRVRLKLMHPDSLLFPIMHGLYKIFRLRHNFSEFMFFPGPCSFEKRNKQGILGGIKWTYEDRCLRFTLLSLLSIFTYIPYL